MTNTHQNINIQRYIFIGGILLFFIKVVAFYITNSVGILSDALESTVNIITGFITLLSLRFAAKPRDEDHPYGHGKVELITSSIEGILIGVAGVMIIIEGFARLGSPPQVVEMGVGIILLVFTAMANYLMGKYSIAQGRKNNSVALVSGGKHLISDTYTTMALIAGLGLFYFTGYLWVDSILAIIFGLVILYTGYTVLRATVNGLMDEADTSTIDDMVKNISDHRMPAWVNIHKLTYLKFGHVSHVDLHLTLPWYYDMSQAKQEIILLKELIRPNIKESEVDISVQSEPCEPTMCHQCCLECPERQKPFVQLKKWTTIYITGRNIFSFPITNKQVGHA
ncbi:MAG: cation diffusion facilitator family transporter [Saprospiraceae bacterium]